MDPHLTQPGQGAGRDGTPDMADLTAEDDHLAKRAVVFRVTSLRDGREHLVAEEAMTPGERGPLYGVVRAWSVGGRNGLPGGSPVRGLCRGAYRRRGGCCGAASRWWRAATLAMAARCPASFRMP